MTTANFPDALAFVWRAGFDNPRDGYHSTPHDPGLGTMGGITEATWARALGAGLVSGKLADATLAQLSVVLETYYWKPVCEALPPGVDLAFFNGVMMSGHFPRLFQQCLGLIGSQVDGVIGPETLKLARIRDAETLIAAMCGVHAAYLAELVIWPTFGAGWSRRILAALQAACLLIPPPPPRVA